MSREHRSEAADFPSLRIAEHALVQHHLARLRETRTSRAELRRALAALSALLAYELTRDLPTRRSHRSTPNGTASVARVETSEITVVAILRAGLGMLDPFLELLPGARIGLVGIERRGNERRPHVYCDKLLPDTGGPVLVVDPMIATGRSASRAIDLLNQRGVEDQRIRLAAAVVAPEGMRRFSKAHPDVRCVAAALDSHLNDAREIVPGVGDAGDRLFGAPGDR